MHAWDKPQISIKTDEPVFHMVKGENYGRIVNLANGKVHGEYVKYKIINGKHAEFPLSDIDFVDFEIYVSKRYKKDFTTFVNAYGGIASAKKCFDTASKSSWLLNYWAERIEEFENTFSASYRLETCTADSA
ncbi:MAG: hypothetical protein MJ168_05510 [Clostridia bacterium]|nr:hypothetical protein [Clostridia bacterium]